MMQYAGRSTASLMHSHEIIQTLSAEEAAGILEHLRGTNKEGYRAALAALAARRKLRPVFVERKPVAERNAWMARMLGLKMNEDLAAELLQSWLLDAHRPMIIAFLDAQGIKHDGEGLLDDVPPEPAAEAVDAAVDLLLQQHDRAAALIYLRLFAASAPGGWPHLQKRLDALTAVSTTSEP